jgi:hypothetical protein
VLRPASETLQVSGNSGGFSVSANAVLGHVLLQLDAGDASGPD